MTNPKFEALLGPNWPLNLRHGKYFSRILSFASFANPSIFQFANSCRPGYTNFQTVDSSRSNWRLATQKCWKIIIITKRNLQRCISTHTQPRKDQNVDKTFRFWSFFRLFVELSFKSCVVSLLPFVGGKAAVCKAHSDTKIMEILLKFTLLSIIFIYLFRDVCTPP